jgi:protein-tyrosine phosphatase
VWSLAPDRHEPQTKRFLYSRILTRVPGFVALAVIVWQTISVADRARRSRRNPGRVSVSAGQLPRAHGLSSKLSWRAGAPIRLWGSERVDAVFWIEGNPPVPLAIVLCPYGGSGLKDELREIAQNGVQTLVSLLEPDEADWLGLAEESALAEQLGMHFISHPIQDVHVPVNVHMFRKFVAGLADRLRAGERIGLHCRGSIGRAPLTAACTLIHLGWDAKDALAAIQAARGCEIPDTTEQLRWIQKYKAQP